MSASNLTSQDGGVAKVLVRVAGIEDAVGKLYYLGSWHWILLGRIRQSKNTCYQSLLLPILALALATTRSLYPDSCFSDRPVAIPRLLL